MFGFVLRLRLFLFEVLEAIPESDGQNGPLVSCPILVGELFRTLNTNIG